MGLLTLSFAHIRCSGRVTHAMHTLIRWVCVRVTVGTLSVAEEQKEMDRDRCTRQRKDCTLTDAKQILTWPLPSRIQNPPFALQQATSYPCSITLLICTDLNSKLLMLITGCCNSDSTISKKPSGIIAFSLFLAQF